MAETKETGIGTIEKVDNTKPSENEEKNQKKIFCEQCGKNFSKTNFSKHKLSKTHLKNCNKNVVEVPKPQTDVSKPQIDSNSDKLDKIKTHTFDPFENDSKDGEISFVDFIVMCKTCSKYFKIPIYLKENKVDAHCRCKIHSFTKNEAKLAQDEDDCCLYCTGCKIDFKMNDIELKKHLKEKHGVGDIIIDKDFNEVVPTVSDGNTLKILIEQTVTKVGENNIAQPKQKEVLNIMNANCGKP